jgi:para-aminobenzoate synthetase
VKTLLIDNFDSYTYNLFQLIAVVNGTEPVVMLNNDPRLAELDFTTFDNIVISPGPGCPQSARDLAFAMRLLTSTTPVPVLGVCLGHQGLGFASGGEVGPAPQPRHGHLARIRHDGADLFAGVPQDFVAVRYHSLAVAEPLPASIVATAWADDGVLMGLRHRSLPRWGVQFHPESVATEHGHTMLENFRRLTQRHQPRIPAPRMAPRRESRPAAARAVTGDLLVRELAWAVDTPTVFTHLHSSSPYAFWLDSSRVEEGLARFSFLGDATGPLSEVLTYRVPDDHVTIRDRAGRERAERGDIFEVLERRLAARRVAADSLPFDFTCGYVGYFGYELKALCGSSNRHTADSPDAVWMFADRLVAVDHREGRTYLLAFADGTEDVRRSAKAWLDRTAQTLAVLRDVPARPSGGGDRDRDVEPWLVRDRSGYLDDIVACQRHLHSGESYEICLTNKLRLPFPAGNDLAYYLRLRKMNPAPYAALLQLGGLSVFSSSPERFLRVTAVGTVESKPIKGTAPVDLDPHVNAALIEDLASSEKTRAENLMIVDLVRNDLGRACEVGSVSVPSFMAVETYATVHQLVSTIRGTLRPEVGPVECVQTCFPGGSMTGAPKLRTMEIIDSLETEARGVYSGALGYFGLTNTADLSIVIRTAVRQGDELTIGAGGAIVLASSPPDEFDEMKLKAQSTFQALTDAAFVDRAASRP